MSAGLTRKEQWALLGLIVVIFLGLAVRQWRERPWGENETLAIEGQGTWRKLAELEATDPVRSAHAALPASGSPRALPAPHSTTTTLAGVIDLNAADAALIETLPGIGPSKAEAILALRARLGGFQSVEQLNDVPGIGDKTLERLRPLVVVRGGAAAPSETTPAETPQAAVTAPPEPALASNIAPAPPSQPDLSASNTLVNINQATVAELESLPGIGPALAQRILQDRQARGPFRTIDDLDRVSGIGPAKLTQLRPHVRID